MSGYCPDCGNDLCLCDDIKVEENRIVVEPFIWSKESELENRLKEAEEHLRFTLRAAEYLFKPEVELKKDMNPTFYFTLSYEGDVDLVEKTKRAREYFKKYGKEND